MTDWEQRSKENDIKIHKLEERINDLELEMKAEEVGQAGANQLIQERLEKLESSQCPHLKVGIATLNTKDMYCIHHSIFKEEAKEEIFQIIQRSKKKGCIGGKEKIEPLVKDSECERLNEEKWSLEKEISIRDKEIERLKKMLEEGKKWVSWHARGDVMITHKGLKGLWKKLGGETE